MSFWRILTRATPNRARARLVLPHDCDGDIVANLFQRSADHAEALSLVPTSFRVPAGFVIGIVDLQQGVAPQIEACGEEALERVLLRVRTREPPSGLERRASRRCARRVSGALPVQPCGRRSADRPWRAAASPWPCWRVPRCRWLRCARLCAMPARVAAICGGAAIRSGQRHRRCRRSRSRADRRLFALASLVSASRSAVRRACPFSSARKRCQVVRAASDCGCRNRPQRRRPPPSMRSLQRACCSARAGSCRGRR